MSSLKKEEAYVKLTHQMLNEMAKENYNVLLHKARRRLGNIDLAYDVVQATWLRILTYPKKILALPPDIPPDRRGLYIRSILRHEIAKTMQQYHRPNEDSLDSMEKQIGDHTDMEEKAINNVMIQDIYDFVQQLPDQDRVIMTLHFNHHMTAKEIALQLNLSNVAVRKRISRFKQSIRETFNEDMSKF